MFNFIWLLISKLFIRQKEAVAIALEREEQLLGSRECYFYQLSNDMQNRRDRLVKYLHEADLNPVLPGGGYFIVADISKLGLYTTLSSLFNEHVFVFISNIYKLHMC